MKAGRLRHLGAIQHLVSGSPAYKPNGEPDEEWVDLLTPVRMSIEPLRGRELYAAQEHHAQVDTRIRMRYRSGIDAKMRVVFRGLVYDILAVLDSELRRVELELLAKFDPTVSVATATSLGALLLEDGFRLLLEDGSFLLLEASEEEQVSVGLEDGSGSLLLEDGGALLME